MIFFQNPFQLIIFLVLNFSFIIIVLKFNFLNHFIVKFFNQGFFINLNFLNLINQFIKQNLFYN